jgi:HSP20 family protein
MALIRWEPTAGLASLRRDMERLFEDFLGREPFHLGEAQPAVEVSDTKDAIIVKAQVPGVSKEHLQVTVIDDALTLKGEMQEEEKTEGKNYYRREFHYGAFSRTVPLPATVQSDQATAQLKDGIIHITIPKKEAAKVKTIPIQT